MVPWFGCGGSSKKHHLPDNHHFAVHCSGKAGKDFSDEEDDYHQPPWLHGRAFEPSPENPHVSGQWIERVAGAWADQLQRVRDELKNSKRTVRKTHQLAYVSVEEVKDLGMCYDRSLHVLFTPNYDDGLPSHSDIRGIRPEDQMLQQRLADQAVVVPTCPD